MLSEEIQTTQNTYMSKVEVQFSNVTVCVTDFRLNLAFAKSIKNMFAMLVSQYHIANVFLV